MHFSLQLNLAPSLAVWTVSNIDGLRLFLGDSISTSGETSKADPRTGRCRQPRAGLLARCVSHRGQLVTLYNVAGASALLLARLNGAMALSLWPGS